MQEFPQGVITAALTPLKSDLSIDVDRLIRHCLWLLKNGSHGIALLGTTGEANSFSLRERLELLEQIAQSDLPLQRIMVGTGCAAYPDTIALTTKALKLGMNNVLMLPPFFYKQVSDEGLFAYFQKVILEIDAKQLKVFIYHFPKMSGVHMSADLLGQLISEFPDTIVGMKDSSGDFEHMRQICRRFPTFKLYAGTERYLLDVLKIGGEGCISATANVTTSYAGEVFEAWKKKDAQLERMNQQLVNVRSCFEGLPFTAALKQYLAKLQSDPSWLNLRPPNHLLEEVMVDEMIDHLNHLQFHPERSLRPN